MTQQTGLPCPVEGCGSSDAYATYEDGSGFCFSCSSYTHPPKEGEEPPERPVEQRKSAEAGLTTTKPGAIPHRGIQEATAARYGVGLEYNQENREIERIIYPVYTEGKLTGQKIKKVTPKEMWTRGITAKAEFFGANLVGTGRRLLVVTEGEEDCMSAYQLLQSQGKNYSVVSLPFGANIRSGRDNIEWLETFETVCLCFDNDKAGRKGAEEFGDLLTPGKVKVMTLPEGVKDTNEFAMNGGTGRQFLNALNEAKPYRPDGVVSLADSWELMFAADQHESIPWPWDGLNNKLYGLRQREIVTVTAGTGIGKSALIRELEHWLLFNQPDNLGILSLEESVARTAWGIVSVEANLPLSIREERVGVDPALIRAAFDNTIGNGRVFTLDHFGSTNEANLLSRIRYMIKGLQCKWIILDHLSIVVSAMEGMGDERRAIDSIMTNLRQLVEETGAGLLLVSHLRRIDGNRGHEQGVEIGLSHLRGSQAIAQLSDAVIALERNQQADDEREANLTLIRVLKNRYAGLTGLATHLAYDRDTGRLSEVLDKFEYLMPEEETGL